MKINEPTLMWARQHFGGEVWLESASFTKPVAEHWPEADEDEDEKDHQWGEAKLFRITVEAVGSEESDKYLANQHDFLKNRRKP